MVSSQQWMYADFLAPILFPTSHHTPISIGGRSELPSLNLNETNQTNTEEFDNKLISMMNFSNETDVYVESLNRTKRLAEEESDARNSSADMSEVMKNLAFLENDPNAAFKPSSAFFSLMTGGDRGFILVFFFFSYFLFFKINLKIETKNLAHFLNFFKLKKNKLKHFNI